ncbi:transcriptional regulator, GntR family [Gleimia coleocanis DSM 15436]|uniref:Transcriptional regulator, GntR family n=2 Tax=Gleimia TaxID=2692113 RepID=C0VY71_9ACTO|nr:transcriptional regulator, GntR family [Gleimia coleocanis DSM 15436]
MIHNRELAPGERLIERNLAEALEVSRVPVREALLMLRKEGLVFDKPDAGLCVIEVCKNEHDKFLEVLNALDALVMRRVFDNRSPELLAVLQENLIKTRDFIEKQRYTEAYDMCVEFHKLIRNATCSPYLVQLCEQTEFLMTWHLPKEVVVEENFETHQRIYDALADGKRDEFYAVFIEHNEIMAETFGEAAVGASA